MPRCPSCGEWADEDEQFCDYCGIKLPHNAPDDRWDKRATTEAEPTDGGPATTTAREMAAGKKERPLHEREPLFEFLLRHPFRSGHRPVLISVVLALGSFLVVPALILAGYGYKLGRSVIFEEETPPTYDDWAALAIQGVRLVIVMSVPALLVMIGASILIGLMLIVLPAAGGLASIVFFFALLGLLWVVGAYVAAFLGSDSVPGAFLDGRARALLSTDLFFKFWVLFLLLFFPALVIMLVVSGPLFILLTINAPLPIVLLGVPIAAVGTAAVVGYGFLVALTYSAVVYLRAVRRGIVPEPDKTAEEFYNDEIEQTLS